MLRTSIAKKRGKTPVKESPRTPTRSDKKSNARSFALINNSSDKKKAKQPPTPESSSDSDSDNDGEFEVEAILGKKVNREGTVFYRIKWKGFDLRYATWEPAENVSNAPKLIENYEKSLKADGNDDKGDRSKRQTRDVLRKRGLNELTGRKKGDTRKNNSRRKMTESEEEEDEEEEDFYDDGTDEEEADDQDSDEEEGEEGEEEIEEESSEEEEEVEEEKGGRRGKKAPVANVGRKGTKKLKTETPAPVKEISKEKKNQGKVDSTPPVVQETQPKRKQVGKLRIQEDIEESPVAQTLAQSQPQQKDMQIESEAAQEEVKEAQEEKPIAPMEITRLAMLEENEEKAIIPPPAKTTSKKDSLVTEPITTTTVAAPVAQITTPETITTNPTEPPVVLTDPELMKNMIIEEESPEKAQQQQQIDNNVPATVSVSESAVTVTETIKSLSAAPTKSARDDADHATNVLRELGRTSSAFKINVEGKSDFNNMLLTRNNSGFQQTGSAFQTSKTTILPQKDNKPSSTETSTTATAVNPNPNSANPLLGLLHGNSKDSAAIPSALPFGGNPLLHNPLLYGMNMGNNRPIDDEEARKNQIVFQGYLQISNYMLPQNNPMALNNNRMRNMLGANLPGFPMNPLHHPFLPGAPGFPNYFGMPNPLLAANPLFAGMPGAMGMPALPNYFGAMGLPGANMPRNNAMFNEMMAKSGLSPSMLQGLQGGTGASTPSGAGGKDTKDTKSKGGKDIIVVDDKHKDGGADGKKKEVAGDKK